MIEGSQAAAWCPALRPEKMHSASDRPVQTSREELRLSSVSTAVVQGEPTAGMAWLHSSGIAAGNVAPTYLICKRWSRRTPRTGLQRRGHRWAPLQRWRQAPLHCDRQPENGQTDSSAQIQYVVRMRWCTDRMQIRLDRAQWVALHLEPSERHHRCRPVRVAHHAQIDRIERRRRDWPQVLRLLVEVTVGCGQRRLVVPAAEYSTLDTVPQCHSAAQSDRLSAVPKSCEHSAHNRTPNKRNKPRLWPSLAYAPKRSTGVRTAVTPRMYRHTRAHARHSANRRARRGAARRGAACLFDLGVRRCVLTA